MADSITTTTTLKAACLELESVIDSLLDAAEFITAEGGDPLKPHEAAWAQVKRDLLRRRPPMEEADVEDTSLLQHATHLCVLHVLFRLSDTEADKVTAEKYWQRYRKEMREVNLNDDVAQASETLLVRG